MADRTHSSTCGSLHGSFHDGAAAACFPAAAHRLVERDQALVQLAMARDKQVLLGEESIDYGPGQSMLTTIDLPVVSHVTRASGAEPFLGMMLTLDVRSIVQMASEMEETRQRREDGSRSISFEVLDADLLDALVRLVKLLGQPALVPPWRR